MNKNLIKLIAKIIISVGILVFLLIRTDISKVWISFQQIPILSLIIVISLSWLFIIISAIKWNIFLPGYTFWQLLRFNFIGVLYSTFFIGQLTGDAVRAYKLGRSSNNLQGVTASTIIDKITGFIAMLTCGLGGVLLTSARLPNIILIAHVAMIGAIVFGLLLLKVKKVNAAIISILKYIECKLPAIRKVTGFIVKLFEDWHFYVNKPMALLTNTLLGLLTHLVAAAILFTLSNALQLNISFYDWCWIYSLLSIALLLPFTIAGLGVRDATLISLLALFGVSSDKSMTISFVLLFYVLLNALIGFIFDLSIIKNSGHHD